MAIYTCKRTVFAIVAFFFMFYSSYRFWFVSLFVFF